MIPGSATSTTVRAPARALVVLAAVAIAVVVNLLVFTVGRLAGGDFAFTRGGAAVAVDAATVAGFTALPLGLGLAIVAVSSQRVRWVARVALVVAPTLALATILLMTVPADLDTVSTMALAGCHVTLVPISLIAIRRLAAST